MSKPVDVLISDIHYNLANLELADAALRQAIKKANDLEVQLIIAGDLHDTKANLRGECINAMIKTFEKAVKRPIVLVGNHDKINEKSVEHSLNFLDGTYAEVINAPLKTNGGIYLIPYCHAPSTFVSYCMGIPKGSIVIAHQGIVGSNMGDYIQDKSAITRDDVAGLRVISGHYHSRQTIKLPDGGTWDYIGNPYTTSYGEANDPEKGFQILMDDGSLEFIATDLRAHRIWELTPNLNCSMETYSPGDLLWIKVRGTHEELGNITRNKVAQATGIEYFRLDLIPNEAATQSPIFELSNDQLFDSLIDSLSNTSDTRKQRLKDLWKNLI